MSILSGNELDPKLYFKSGSPSVQASSFDLSIGKIFGCDGVEIKGPFTLKPGHMVQVVSDEIFNLPDDVTGHVTYKTGLTREGIWALTVGIVDPGWDGPVATTLLNFSRVDHTIHPGDRFLRVSLLKHSPVAPGLLRKSKPLPEYLKEIQSFAASRFPSTFLNSEKIVQEAGQRVFGRLRNEGLAWLGFIVIIFTIIQVFAVPAARWVDAVLSPVGATELQLQLKDLRQKLDEMEKKQKAEAAEEEAIKAETAKEKSAVTVQPGVQQDSSTAKTKAAD